MSEVVLYLLATLLLQHSCLLFYQYLFYPVTRPGCHNHRSHHRHPLLLVRLAGKYETIDYSHSTNIALTRVLLSAVSHRRTPEITRGLICCRIGMTGRFAIIIMNKEYLSTNTVSPLLPAGGSQSLNFQNKSLSSKRC